MSEELPPGSSGRLGLVLPGGGARAAYQVGVLRAIADLLPARACNPFPVVAGTSAGAVNAIAIAVYAERFRVAVGNLERVWRNFQVNQVFKSDSVSLLRSMLHWGLAMFTGGLLLSPPKSLLDNSPLRELLGAQFDFERIGRAIDAGQLDAVTIAAAGYSSARSVSFFQGRHDITSWRRLRRAGEPTQLSLDHIMASVAVPFLFPPVLMEGEYFGDGSMRQANPFSPVIHLGADRLLVIATRNDAHAVAQNARGIPTFGQIFGYMLDALFTDGVYSDVERLTQINRLVEQGITVTADGTPLKKIELMAVVPSRDLSEIARHHTGSLPRGLRALLRAMGATHSGGGQLMSYLLFQDSFTRELMALGYQDAMRCSEQLLDFINGGTILSTSATGMMRRLVGGDRGTIFVPPQQEPRPAESGRAPPDEEPLSGTAMADTQQITR